MDEQNQIQDTNDLDQIINDLADQESPVINDTMAENRNILQKQEMEEIQKISDDLMDYSYDQLVQKYIGKDLNFTIAAIRPITNLNVIDNILLLRQLFITSFVPSEITNKIDSKNKEQIVLCLANLNANSTQDELLNQLQKINPDLIVPANLNLANSQTNAKRLNNAIQNIKKIIATNLAPTYLTDVMHLLKLPDEKLKILSEQLINISEQIQNEYLKLEHNEKIDTNVINKTIDFIDQTGRTPLAIAELRQSKNLGDITNLILQITTAIRVVNTMKSKNIGPNINKDIALVEIITDINSQLTL